MRKETRFIEIDGKKICFYDCGDTDNPTILMGHSYLWSKHMWEPQIEALAENHHLIIPDLWGHGESEGLPESITDIAGMAECYFQLMQKLGIEQFSIIGLSVGGMWGAELALAHPNEVTGLVMMDTYVGAEPKVTQKKYLALIATLRQDGFTHDMIENLWPYFFSPTTRTSNSKLIEDYKLFLKGIRQKMLNDIADAGNMIFTRRDLLPRLGELTIPVNIIVGKDDGPRPPKEAHEMAKHAKCEVTEVVDGGHICNIEKPEVVSEHLLECLRAFNATPCLKH